MELSFLGTGAHDYAKSLTTDFRDKFDKDARRSSARDILSTVATIFLTSFV